MALRIRTKHPYNVVEGDIFLDIPAAERLLNTYADIRLRDRLIGLKYAVKRGHPVEGMIDGIIESLDAVVAGARAHS